MESMFTLEQRMAAYAYALEKIKDLSKKELENKYDGLCKILSNFLIPAGDPRYCHFFYLDCPWHFPELYAKRKVKSEFVYDPWFKTWKQRVKALESILKNYKP